MQNIQICQMKHSDLNVKIRDKDTPPVKDKEGNLRPNPALAVQAQEFTNDILRGQDILHTPGMVDGQRNPALGWLPSSAFIVEPAQDGTPDRYEVLSGRHRLDWILGVIAVILDAAKKAKEQGEVDRLNALADTWKAFEIPCDIRHPKNDAERREIIAEGNPDDNKKARIVQSYPSRFAAFYPKFPTPSFLCHWSKGKEPVAEFDTKDNGAWSNASFQSITGIRGNFHTTYYALMCLGKHFEIPVEFFERGNRLKIRQQVTQAILLKTSPLGEPKTNAVTNIYDYGFIVRYKEGRANCKGTATESLAAALMRVKDEFKQEFVEDIMDGDLRELESDYVTDEQEGQNALGNAPEKTEAEKKAENDAKEAERQEEADAAAERTASNQPFKFAQDAVGRALNAPNAPTIAPHLGTLFDLFLTLDAKRFEPAAKSLAAWKKAHAESKANASDLAEVAFQEVADIVTATAIEMDAEPVAEPVAEAASATANTPRKRNTRK